MNEASGPNADQKQAWNGELGRSWVTLQDRYETMLRPYAAQLLAAAGVGAREDVLDVGCGCGETTLLAAERTSGRVLGVDLSEPMLAVARARVAGAGGGNATFLHADAQTHPFQADSFDVALSRFGVMFFDDPVAAFANLADAVRPGGRMAFLCWQEQARNGHRMVPWRALASVVPLLEDAAPPPAYSLADPDRVRDVLHSAGWRHVDLAAVQEPLLVGTDAGDATDFMMSQPATRTLLAEVDEATTAAAAAAVRQAFAQHVTPAGVLLGSAAWLVTARRP